MSAEGFWQLFRPGRPTMTAIDLAVEIADDAAASDIESFSANAIRVGKAGPWLYDVITPEKVTHPTDDPEWSLAQVQRAVKYLHQRGRVELVVRRGRTWVRILPVSVAS